MPKIVHADASPEKRLFISLLTRDISLEAAFLDLIDNSVNAALAPFADRLLTADDYLRILDDPVVQPKADISILISRERIIITDTAPGIWLETARRHVFRFGRPEDDDDDDGTDRLSVYGLGLKRAIFKTGCQVQIVSDHALGGFSLDLDVNQWAKTDTPRWEFDILPRPSAPPPECGTSITISDLREETSSRLADGVFVDSLKERISRTYSYFLTKFVRISVNGDPIPATVLRVGRNTATDSFKDNSITCTVTAGLGTPEGGKYRDRGSGWFVFCNGRNIVSADKTALTGWQGQGLPIFQPKHRPFLGTVFFVSKQPDLLPWDTTKSGINADSALWQRAKLLMTTVGRSVTAFLDSRYSDEGSEVEHTDLSGAAGERVDVIHASSGKKRAFDQPAPPPKENTQVQFSAKKKHVRMIAEYLSRPSMGAAAVGRHTFDFFLRNEVGED